MPLPPEDIWQSQMSGDSFGGHSRVRRRESVCSWLQRVEAMDGAKQPTVYRQCLLYPAVTPNINNAESEKPRSNTSPDISLLPACPLVTVAFLGSQSTTCLRTKARQLGAFTCLMMFSCSWQCYEPNPVQRSCPEFIHTLYPIPCQVCSHCPITLTVTAHNKWANRKSRQPL